MQFKVGFIGFGNMASAIAKGVIASGFSSAENIICSDVSKNAKNKATQMGITYSNSNEYIAKESEIIVLAIKPNILPLVIEEIRGQVNENTLIISIVAGQSIEKIEQSFLKPIKLIITMPNTPALIGEGMTAYVTNSLVSDQEESTAIQFLSSFGKIQKIDEKWMPAVIAASGSSPAYVFLFLEALADAAVLLGMPRELAYEFSSQAVLGSAKMLLEENIHPGILKDQVCSPGGTTIEAVKVLEDQGFRSAIINAALAAAEKSKEL